MKVLFAMFLQASIFGSLIILLILLLRILLRKAPRKIICLLWLLAALRLLLPFQLESQLSLQPHKLSQAVFQTVASHDAIPDQTPAVPDPEYTEPIGKDVKSIDFIQILAVVWSSIAGAAILYGFGSYFVLKRKVREAVKYSDGVMEIETIHSAFLLGYFKPTIYIPLGLNAKDRAFVLTHEHVHISRGDVWWKLLGYICACLHWFNPLVCLGYAFFCQDLEISCDEQVVQNLTLEERKEYSLALLSSIKKSSGVISYPVAFGEVSLKQRIKNVLSYRKPGLWITAIATALVLFVAVCFMTSPEAEAIDLPVPDNTMHPTDETTAIPTIAATEAVTLPEETTTASTDHIHTYVTETVAPTCTKNGYQILTCQCGFSYHDHYINALGHDYQYWYTAAPTTANRGFDAFQCSICSDIHYDNYVAALIPLDCNSLLQTGESYAYSLGFQVIKSHSTQAAKHWTTSMDEKYLTLFRYENNFYNAIRYLIDDAYESIGSSKAEAARRQLWIHVTYSNGVYKMDVYIS